jgi:hypothetical protein
MLPPCTTLCCHLVPSRKDANLPPDTEGPTGAILSTQLSLRCAAGADNLRLTPSLLEHLNANRNFIFRQMLDSLQ